MKAVCALHEVRRLSCALRNAPSVGARRVAKSNTGGVVSKYQIMKGLAPRPGLEPGTLRLTVAHTGFAIFDDSLPLTAVLTAIHMGFMKVWEARRLLRTTTVFGPESPQKSPQSFLRAHAHLTSVSLARHSATHPGANAPRWRAFTRAPDSRLECLLFASNPRQKGPLSSQRTQERGKDWIAAYAER